MLRKISSIMPSSSQLKSSSWLISVLIHVALIAVVSEVYTIKTNHKNDGLKAFEFVIYQPEPDKLSQKETPKDTAKAASKVNPKTASKQSVVSKPNIFSEAKITSQSKSVSEPKVLPSEISKKKLKTTPKPKPKPTIIAKETVPTKQMGVSLIETLATAPTTEQIQTKIFESKKSYNLEKITNEKNSNVDLLETAQSTKTDSMNSNLYNKNQNIITQTKYFTSTTELAVRKKLLKNWAATIRNDIVERTLELKLRSDVRISLKISRTGEILNIKTIGVSVNNQSIKNFINVIRTSGKFPMAPRGLKLDYVTFPVNFRSRG